MLWLGPSVAYTAFSQSLIPGNHLLRAIAYSRQSLTPGNLQSAKMLLDLPLEVRRMIYGFLYQSYEDEHCITPDIYGTRYYLDNLLGRTKQLTPTVIVRKNSAGLLRTCKQVNAEATNILYGVNTFVFTETMHPI